MRRLTEWQTAAGMTQRQMAALIGCHESWLSKMRSDPNERPSGELMSRAIAVAPEPWKSALKQARQADQDAADLAAAQAVVA